MNNIAREKIWFFDFDGTLSPIVPDRTKAELHPECRKMLQRLASNPMFQVAVLSSRKLDDLAPRVPVQGLFLGGSSGTEWEVPGGHRMTLSGNPVQRLEVIREQILPGLFKLANIQGIEVEDKKWSVALHTRNASPGAKLMLSSRLSSWEPAFKTRIFRGPEVYEVQLLPRINKSFGVKYLLRFLKLTPYANGIVYAGDDENDATAMRLVTRLGGTAITVGECPLIPSSKVVINQKYLAEEVCNLLSL